VPTESPQVDRRFGLGGKLKTVAKATADFVMPAPEADPGHADAPVLKRVRRRLAAARERIRERVQGAEPSAPSAGQSSTAQLSMALFLLLPSAAVLMLDHRDEVQASWAALSRVFAAALAAAAVEASQNAPALIATFAAADHPSVAGVLLT